MDLQGATPGSLNEKRVCELIERELEDHVDQVYRIDIPVYSWRHRCLLEVDGVNYPCVQLPYSRGVDLPLSPGSLLIMKSLDEIHVNPGILNGKFVIAPYPKDPFTIRALSFILARYGSLGAIFFMNKPGLYKSDTVLSSIDVDYSPSMPIDIPVVSIDSQIANILSRSGGYLRTEGVLEKSTGRVILAYINKRGDKYVHIFTHHDALLGEIDFVPSRILGELARELRESSSRHNIVLISYTAKEIGDYEFTSYHYTWGERYALRLLENRGELDSIVYSVAIDHLTGEGEIKTTGHLMFSKLINDLGLALGDNCLFTEIHPYMEHGIPSILISDEFSSIHRNTTSNYDKEKLRKTRDRISKLVKEIVERLEPSKRYISELRRYSIDIVGERELEKRVVLTRVLDLEKLYENDEASFIKTYTMIAYEKSLFICLEPFKAYLDGSLWSVLKQNIIGEIKETVSRCNKDLLINVAENRVWLIKPGVDYLELLNKQLSMRVFNNISNKIDNVIFKTLCKKLARREISGEEIDRHR